MEAEDKLFEIYLKTLNEKYTIFDQLQDFGEAIIELTVSDPEEKKKLKLVLALARKKAEILYNNNDNNKKN